MKKWPRRKLIRLELETYRQAGFVASITAVTRDRRPVFADPTMAQVATSTLVTLASTTDVRVHAYCVMPDHAHLLLDSGKSLGLTTYVGRFKGLAQREMWLLGVKGLVWQRSFYDHFLRAEDDLHTAVSYVLNNPVRAGLVDAWTEYPHSGSLVWDLLDDDA